MTYYPQPVAYNYLLNCTYVTILLMMVISPAYTKEASFPELLISSNLPAPKWDHGYPIGNGRLGLLSLGDWPQETLYLNENSIWARQEVSHKDSATLMNKIRELASEGKHQEADEAWVKGFLEPMWRPASYEFAGMAHIHHLDIEKPTSVSNTLNLRTGLNQSKASFTDGTITREAVALRNRDVIAMRIATTRPRGIQIRLEMSHPRDKVTCNDNQIIISGQAATGGTTFESYLLVLPESNDYSKQVGNSIEVNGGKELLLLFNIGTNYNHKDPNHPLTTGWKEEALELLARSSESAWKTLREEAAAEMRSFMNCFTIDLGKSSDEVLGLTTGERVKRYGEGESDPDLEELLFQFGRYFVVASNRVGELPSNLQGLWSEGLSSPWSADYHLNINLQMNYWPVEPTGLSELHQPMLDFVTAMQPSAKSFAKSLGLEGACCGHAVNAWMNTRFSGNRPLWAASLMNGAWITSHMLEHYRYSGDKEFLKQQAWPVIQENAKFILSWLQWDEENKEWITGPGNSPENMFRYTADNKETTAAVSCGTTHDLMLAWESLSDLIEAAQELDIENNLVKQAKETLPNLAEGRIGADGRMQEWREPFGENSPGHRHVSHAYGFFPSRQYNLIEHPKQAAAIAKSLDFRLANGGGHTGWSRAWLISIEACLQRPEAAYQNVRKLISKMTNPNLFTLHPPFQIDANFGYTSGIVTMLMQSQMVLESGERVIWLLPTLPEAWPAGKVTGLRARGGLLINLEWTASSAKAHITATRDGKFQIRCRNETKPLNLKTNEECIIDF